MTNLDMQIRLDFVKIDDEFRHADTIRLRNLDLLHANVGPALSQKCDLFFLKRKDYEQRTRLR